MRISLSIALLSILLIGCVIGCQQRNEDSTSPENLFGTVSALEKSNKTVEIEAAGWAREVGLIPEESEVGYIDAVQINENSNIQYESGENADIDDIQVDQEITVIENEEGEVETIILHEK